MVMGLPTLVFVIIMGILTTAVIIVITIVSYEYLRKHFYKTNFICLIMTKNLSQIEDFYFNFLEFVDEVELIKKSKKPTIGWKKIKMDVEELKKDILNYLKDNVCLTSKRKYCLIERNFGYNKLKYLCRFSCRPSMTNCPNLLNFCVLKTLKQLLSTIDSIIKSLRLLILYNESKKVINFALGIKAVKSYLYFLDYYTKIHDDKNE